MIRSHFISFVVVVVVLFVSHLLYLHQHWKIFWSEGNLCLFFWCKRLTIYMHAQPIVLLWFIQFQLVSFRLAFHFSFLLVHNEIIVDRWFSIKSLSVWRIFCCCLQYDGRGKKNKMRKICICRIFFYFTSHNT